MWVIVKKIWNYSENIILSKNKKDLIIAKVRKFWNNNFVNFYNKFSVEHGDKISETIFTDNFYNTNMLSLWEPCHYWIK